MARPSTSSHSNWLDNFVASNAWAILTLLIAVSIWGASLMKRVEATENKIFTMQEQVEKIAVIEEKINNINSNVIEIKSDIKEIKREVQ